MKLNSLLKNTSDLKINICYRKSTPGRKKTRVGRLNLDINRILEPVDVFCRLKPLPLPEEKSCITVTSPEVIQLSPPDMSKNSKILQCNFHHVFTEHSPQKDVILKLYCNN